MLRNPKDRSHKISGSYIEFNFKLIKDDRLNWAEKAYYAILLDRASFEGRGYSFQTHETMEELGFTITYSKKISKKLHALGLINKQRSKNGFISSPLEFYSKTISKLEEEEGIYMKIVKH